MSLVPPEAGSDRRLTDHPLQSLARLLAVVLLFSAATIIVFWQWMPHLRVALIGPPEDNMQDFWNTWYAAAASQSNSFFFTDLIRFPEGTPLYYHSFAYPQVFAIAALAKVVGTDTTTLVLLHNLSLLISFPLAGVGAFYLVRHFSVNVAGALLGGYVFAFNPSHVEHVMHHAHVSSIEFIPFFVLCYLLTIERKSPLLLAVSIALYALTALSCWYYLFYVAYFIAFHTVFVALRDRALPKGWQLLAPAACLAGVVIALSPILVPMVSAAMSGASVYAKGTSTFVADLLAYPAFPRFHLLAPLADDIYARLRGNVWEATVYLGLINIALLAWWSRAAWHSCRWQIAYVLSGMAVFAILASGDWLFVLGERTIPMPGAVLSQLPFFGNVRTPSRAIVFVYLFLAIGLGHAVALALRDWQGPVTRWGMVALIVLDFYPARGLAKTPVVCSPGLAIIRDDADKGFGVLDLPGGYVEGNRYMLQQAACHGRPILQGNTSRVVIRSLADRLETTDLHAQRAQLAAAKVKYIVIRKNMRWRPRDGSRDKYFATYPAAYSDADLTILKVY